jgi:GNAT superfamily N-acetyltransferase
MMFGRRIVRTGKPSFKVTIRAAAPEDATAVVRMLGGLARQLGDPDHIFDETAFLRDAVGESAAVLTFVAVCEKLPIAVAMVCPAYEPNYAARGLYLAAIWVDEPYRRGGVARLLLSAVAAAAVERGLSFLWWTSNIDNTGAHRFYATVESVTKRIRAHAVFGDQFAALLAAHPDHSPVKK